MKHLAVYSLLSLLIANSAISGEVETAALRSEDQNRFIVTPESSTFQRFSFEIPQKGYSDALKYQDATALFYSTNIINNGLSFNKHVQTAFNLAPNSLGLHLGLPISEDSKFHIGYTQKTAQAQITNGLEIGLEYITNQSRIIRVQLGTNNLNHTNLFFRSTGLASDETTQHSYWGHTNLNRNDLACGYEIRFFEVADEFDMLLAASIDGNKIKFSPAIEIQSEQKTFQFGFEFDQEKTSAQVYISLAFAFREKSTQPYLISLASESNQRDAWSNAPNLNETRRSYLQTLWRSNIGFERNQRTH